MIVVLKPTATENDIKFLTEKIREWGLQPMVSKGEFRTIVGIIGDETKIMIKPLAAFPFVEKVIPIMKPYKLASREYKDKTVIKINGVEIGGNTLTVIAGPCSVEDEEQMLSTAKAVKEAGAHMLRGGAYKPRTSPYSFQGLGKKGLEILKMAKEQTGLPVVTEVMDPRDVELVAEYADVLQIGARNMQNFSLLKEVGKCRKPVLLKRGLSATIKEWLMAAEYILVGGNEKVILCERGIRTFETATRNTLDVSAVAVLKHETHLPVCIDPSHAAGNFQYVIPLAMAGVAAGADAVMVEVHPNPPEALSDGDQSLNFTQFSELMMSLRKVTKALGREL